MDEKLLRSINRQLRLLNIWMFTTLVLVVATLGLILFLALQALAFIQQTRAQVTQVQRDAREAADLRDRLCRGEGSVSVLLRGNTDICR